MKARIASKLQAAAKPAVGLLSVLFSAAIFMVFLAGLTFVIRWIME